MSRIISKIAHLFLCSDLGALCLASGQKLRAPQHTKPCWVSTNVCYFRYFSFGHTIHRTQYLCAKTAHCSTTPRFTIFPLSVSISFHNQVLKVSVFPTVFLYLFCKYICWVTFFRKWLLKNVITPSLSYSTV